MPDAATQPAANARRGPVGELLGALNASASSISIAAAMGTLVFAPLGPDATGQGVAAAMLATIVGGAIAALATPTALTISSPRAASCIVVAGFVAALQRLHPEFPASVLIALTSIMVITAGMIQMSAAALRLGRLVRFVPFPVIAGFTHGVAILLLLAYLPLLLGTARAPGLAMPRPEAIAWGPACLGAITLAAALGASRIAARVPAIFLALVVGVAAQMLALQLIPGFDPGATLRLRDVIPAGSPFPEWASVPIALREPAIAANILSFAIAVAAVASIDSLIGSMAMEARTGIRSRPERDLFAQGLGNVAAGLAGGVANSYGPVQAQAAYAGGARTRAAGVLSAACVALLALAAAMLIDRMALAVIAGLMLFVALRIADPWGFTLIGAMLRRRPPPDGAVRAAFLTYLLVALAIVLLDIVAALAVGVMVAALIFIRTVNAHVVRRITLGPSLRSRRLFPPVVTRRLAEGLHKVALIELQGPLFFGTADRLMEEVEKLPASVQFLAFDLRRVQAIDATANAVLTRLHARLKAEGRQMALSGRPEGLGALAGTLPPTFPDRDRAVEWFEERLLADEDLTLAGAEVPAEDFVKFVGVDERLGATLLRATETRAFRAGEMIFRFGDASDYLYFLLAGRVSIMHGAAEAAIRVVTFLPGNVFGNVAFIDKHPRSATAICDVDSRVLMLHRRSLDEVARESPDVFTELYRCLANDLAVRLRAADRLVRENQ